MKGLMPNVLRLAGGGAVAQILSLLAIPVITRLYDAREFGTFSVFSSLLLVLGPISTLRFNSALMITHSIQRVRALLCLSLGSSLVTSVLVFTVVMCAYLTNVPMPGRLDSAVLLVPVGMFLFGVMQSVQFWMIRGRRFSQTAIAQVANTAADRMTAIFAGMSFGAGAGGLIAGRLVGPLLALLVMIKAGMPIGGKPHKHIRRYITIQRWRYIKAIARRYRSFPIFSTWAFLANTLARESPVLLLAVFFGPAAAGYFGLGIRVISMPMQIVGDSIAKVTLAEIRERKDDYTYMRDALLSLYSIALYITIPVVVAIIAGGDGVFALVFGDVWREAGVYAVIVSPLLSAMLCYRVLTVAFDLYERQKNRMYFDVALLLGRVAPLSVIAAAGDTVYVALGAMVVVVFGVYIYGIVHLFHIVGVSVRELLRRTIVSALFLSPIIGLSIAVAKFEHSTVHAFVFLAVFVVIQYIFLFVVKSRMMPNKV